MNELIQLLATEVNINIQRAKYFSIIADCTPDTSHVEQLSITIRYVNFCDNDIEVEICERFMGFLQIDDSTGRGLTGVILGFLQIKNIKLQHCQGQGYDNGANMKGKNKGVQSRILDLNPLAVYIPCGCHSLKLLRCDAAKSSVKSISVFGILGRLYTRFSASTFRWKILTDNVKHLTLKQLSITRWEAKISSVKAVRVQI
jgi:hypothetical protein